MDITNEKTTHKLDKLFELVKAQCIDKGINREQCLSSKQNINQRTLEILNQFKNWFALKDFFLLNTDEIANEKRNVELMYLFISFRSSVIRKTLIETVKSLYGRANPVKGKSFLSMVVSNSNLKTCDLNKVTFFTGGSTTPISDIDLMVLTELPRKCSHNSTRIKTHSLEIQIAITERFNKLFEKRFKVPSGKFFDVNLYVADKNLWRLQHEFANSGENKRAEIATGWYALKSTAIKEGLKYPKLEEIFSGEEIHDNYNPKALNKYVSNWILNSEIHQTMQQRNTAYLQQMKKIKGLLNLCANNPLEKACHQFKEKLALAMILANEAYYNPGALFFQVGLSPEEQSNCSVRAGAALQNIAYAIEHFEPEIPGGRLDEIGILKAAKYLTRVKNVLSFRTKELTNIKSLIITKKLEKKSVPIPVNHGALDQIFRVAKEIKAIKDSAQFSQKPISSFIAAKRTADRNNFNRETISKTLIPLGAKILRSCHRYDSSRAK